MTHILYLFTRTPLHVGAGASVGAIDQPVQRERHTGFPIVPGSTLKGVFADEWTSVVDDQESDPDDRTKTTKRLVRTAKGMPDRDWLFGREAKSGELTAGALQFGEARLLAFPVRSAKGSFAWITSPLILHRAVRDHVLDLSEAQLGALQSGLGDSDDTALFAKPGPLVVGDQIVLEEYAFRLARSPEPASDAEADTARLHLGQALHRLLPEDLVWAEIPRRLVVVTDGMMTHFAGSACEVAQHVRIDDATGTADGGGLFNQENVPSETLLYSIVRAVDERAKYRPGSELRSAACAAEALTTCVREKGVFQFGADASTGLGYCTVRLAPQSTPTPLIA